MIAALCGRLLRSARVAGALCALLLGAGSAAGQNFQILFGFEAPPMRPRAPLVEARDGNFYGTTSFSGDKYGGTIFRMDPAGAVTTLHWFTEFECVECEHALIEGGDGNLYGTAPYGGVGMFGFGYGTIFRISQSGDFSTLHTFNQVDGFYPYAGLTLGSDGNFYGTTYNGPPGSYGTVFRMTPSGTLTTVHLFSADEGHGPLGDLVQGADGSFYGTTYGGGTSDLGTIFRLLPSGALTTLHAFAEGDGGQHPRAGLVFGADGNLYGATPEGGADPDHWGTFFRITPVGGLTNLHAFAAASEGAPTGRLVIASDGNFYAVTPSGGSHGDGAVLRITAAGAVSVLHYFSGADGSFPWGGLVQARDGDFYGTTVYGRPNGVLVGSTFRITASGTFTNLHDFTPGQNDGSTPYAALIQAPDGSLQGTTALGGPNGFGTVFRLSSAAQLTTEVSFSSSPEHGNTSTGALVQGSDGNLYGTTRYGGGTVQSQGTVFRLTPGGVLETLHSFAGDDGAEPVAGLVLGSDGNFYGTTAYGGNANGDGTVFRITPAGIFTTLHKFSGADGSRPFADLIQGSDGAFYGSTYMGGADGFGTVYRITAAGTLTTLHSFSIEDGSNPGTLCQGRDGNFYGLTNGSSVNSSGTVFRITPSGTLTTLRSFTFDEGRWPWAGLIQGSDDAFYGVTYKGGSGVFGIAFRITSSGMFSTLHSFSGADGLEPVGNLVQGIDGFLYGTTTGGGPRGGGVIFRLSAVPPATAAIGGGGRICEGASAVIFADLTGVAPWSITWSDGVTQSGITTSPAARLVSPTKATTYTAAVSDSNGPGTTSGLAVVDLNTLVVAVVAPEIVGEGSSGRVASVDPVPGAVYTWSISNGTMTSGQGTNRIGFRAGTAGTPVTLDVTVAYAGCPPGHGQALVTVAPLGQATQFYVLPPCRLFDTRGPLGSLGGPALAPGQGRAFPVVGACGIPNDATALSVNLTAVTPDAEGFLAITDRNGASNGASSLSFRAASTRANNAIVQVSTGDAGTVGMINGSPGAVHVVMDVNGYFR